MRMVFLVTMFLISSCQKSGDKVTSGAARVTSKEYSACTNNGAESTSSNYIFFSNGTYRLLIVYYDALNCTEASMREIDMITGEYSYNAPTSKMTDRHYKLEIAYISNAEVTNRNNISDCGFSDWTAGEFKNATDNLTCNDGTIMSNSPASVYDAVLTDSIFDDGNTIYNRIP